MKTINQTFFLMSTFSLDLKNHLIMKCMNSFYCHGASETIKREIRRIIQKFGVRIYDNSTSKWKNYGML